MQRTASVLYLIGNPFAWTKTFGLFLFPTLAGWFAGSVAAFQTVPEPIKIHWYENPGVIAAAVTGAFLIGSRLIERYWLTGDKKTELSITSSDKKEELTYQERKDLLSEQKDLERRQIAFYRSQAKLKEIEAFEARIRAHRFGNEVNRLHNHIYKCHHAISDMNGTIPEFQFKYHDELMKDIELEVEQFKKQLSEDIEKSIAPDK